MGTTRKRVNDEWVSTKATIETWRGGPPPYSAGLGTIDVNVTGRRSEMNDNVNKGYKARIQRGEVIMSEMLLIRSEIDPCVISFKNGPFPSWFNGGWQQFDGDWGGKFRAATSLPDVSFLADQNKVAQSALVKAYAKMNSPSVMSGEILSDLEKTAGMLRRPFSGATSLLAKMAKYRKARLGKTAASAAKATAQTWLEYRYGWKPLIMDCETILDETVGQQSRLVKSRNQVARASVSVECTRTLSHNTAVYGTICFVGVNRATRKLRSHAGVIYRTLVSASGKDYGKMLGTRPSDLPSTIWEIVPYSFVVDWFVNVGDFIQAVVPNPYVQVMGNWVTTINETTNEYTSGSITSTDLGLTFNGSYPTHSVKNTSVQRTANSSIATTPTVLQNPLSLLHTVDGLALACGKIISGLGSFRH